MTVDSSGGWLLVSVWTAGAAATLRVQVWRRLRSLGALYLQQSACLLPARDDVVRQVRRLADRVRRHGGSCRLLHVSIADDAEQAQVVAEINATRDEEYDQVLERLPEFLAELGKERARGRTTYAEVEECEADLERYRSWLAKIAARDYFGAPGRAAVEAATAELAAFDQAALSAEAPLEHVPPACRGLVMTAAPAEAAAAGSGEAHRHALDAAAVPGAAAGPYGPARQRKQEPGRQELAGSFTEPLQRR